ncbi:hypothetical protein HHI36_020349 [Cryptolaemus montrouzieri]|uniref:Uncharacterized protein n=1 Tax=Cryptolaemus montrouzieri TaxID=559131 RepID=A0ABD2NAP1_9CUCU
MFGEVEQVSTHPDRNVQVLMISPNNHSHHHKYQKEDQRDSIYLHRALVAAKRLGSVLPLSDEPPRRDKIRISPLATFVSINFSNTY